MSACLKGSLLYIRMEIFGMLFCAHLASHFETAFFSIYNYFKCHFFLVIAFSN